MSTESMYGIGQLCEMTFLIQFIIIREVLFMVNIIRLLLWMRISIDLTKYMQGKLTEHFSHYFEELIITLRNSNWVWCHETHEVSLKRGSLTEKLTRFFLSRFFFHSNIRVKQKFSSAWIASKPWLEVDSWTGG